MLIVNQNRDMLVNFNKVESIDIVADLDGTGKVPYKIYYETDIKREELGKYKTEERAKEVLEDTANAYSDFSYYRNAKDKEKQKEIGMELYMKYRNFEIHKMPEE